MITAELMGKSLIVETSEDVIFTGQCWGVYGSTQGKEEHGRDEKFIELLSDGQSIVLFDSEIKSIKIK